jgi:hypothetical protein
LHSVFLLVLILFVLWRIFKNFERLMPRHGNDLETMPP